MYINIAGNMANAMWDCISRAKAPAFTGVVLEGVTGDISVVVADPGVEKISVWAPNIIELVSYCQLLCTSKVRRYTISETHLHIIPRRFRFSRHVVSINKYIVSFQLIPINQLIQTAHVSVDDGVKLQKSSCSPV